MATCKDCKYYGVCILNRRSADADVAGCKIHEMGDLDFVAVVRCKSCTHSDTIDCSKGMVWCGRMCRYMKEDGFCSESGYPDLVAI